MRSEANSNLVKKPGLDEGTYCRVCSESSSTDFRRGNEHEIESEQSAESQAASLLVQLNKGSVYRPRRPRR